MELIILYGGFGSQLSPKLQSLVEERVTCGYREYARHYGTICYLSPVNGLRYPWERSFPSGAGAFEFCKSRPKAIVLALKHADRGRDFLLTRLPNVCLYYSCGSKHVYNHHADISLVDTKSRIINTKCKLWMKGKDPEFWKPIDVDREFDYALMGKPRQGKNQKEFINQLSALVKERRSILWIGGKGHVRYNGHHRLEVTPMLPPERVRDALSRCKVGVLYTKWRGEGFPQSFLEMAMCGLPVLYSKAGPYNPAYFDDQLSSIGDNSNWIAEAEKLLSRADHVACRAKAVDMFSINKSFKVIQRIAAEVG